MRSFIAIELSPSLRNQLARLYAPYLRITPGIKWVAPDNLHLTLKFLGEITFHQLNQVKNDLNLVCAQHTNFSIVLNGIGAFPNFHHPKVLWAGIKDCPELMEVVKDMVSVVTIGDEKDFHPHITLGRMKEPTSNCHEITENLRKNFPQQFGEFKVEGISLMESFLKPNGPVYRKIHFAKLN